MPPRIASKSSSAPRPDEETIEYSVKAISGEILTRSVSASTRGWDFSLVPSIQGIPMNFIKYRILFECAHWFTIDGRFLLNEEIQQELDLLHGEHVNPITFRRVLQHLYNDKKSPAALKGKTDEERSKFTDAAAHIYTSICHSNAEAMNRHHNLNGFSGRLEQWDWDKVKKIKYDGQVLRYDQIYILSAIANSLKDIDGNPIDMRDAETIAHDKLHLTITKLHVVMLELRNPGSSVTKEVARAMQKPSHKDFFNGLVQGWHKEYSEAKLLRYKACNYESASTPSRDDPAVTTAEAFAGLTVTAPAVGPEVSESRPFDWEEFAKRKRNTESESDAEEETSGPSSKKASKKGKGKRPARP